MKREPGLDLLRAAAISWVLLFHARSEGLGTPLGAFGAAGWMAVDLFFVLSGYLIATQLFEAFQAGAVAPLRTFYLRRAFRILPVFWVIVAVYAAFPTLREQPGLQPAWQFFTFTENFLIDYHRNQALSHAWSLCVEEHFYLLFPLVAWLAVGRCSARGTIAVTLALLLAGVVARAAGWHFALRDGAVLRHQPWRFVEVLYYPSVMRTDGLLVGVLLAAVRCHRPVVWNRLQRQPNLLLTTGFVFTGLAAYVAFPRVTFVAAVFGFPLLALGFGGIVAAAAGGRSWLSRLEVPGARWAALLTFSIYLSHKMTWHTLRLLAPTWVPTGTAQAFVVYGVAAVAVGAVLYFAVEQPFLRWRRRWEPARAATNRDRVAEAASASGLR
jgi:peptidoglycan/LPS O-acetylase OafA/YrhL